MGIRLTIAQWLCVVVVTVLCLASGSLDPQRVVAYYTPPPVDVPLVLTVPFPEVITQTPIASLSATGAYAVDLQTGQVLFDQNAHATYAPASTTKLMTALIARQRFDLDEVVTVSSVPFEDGRQPLRAGQLLTVRELLAALLIASNNTAAFTLANHHSGGYQGFIADMNQQAAAFGMSATHFMNPAGFDDLGHKTTARDLSVLMRAALMDPVIQQLIGTKSHSLVDSSSRPIGQLNNTHQLLGVDPRVLAGKTGTTDEAKQVLISEFTSTQHPYIIVVLGSIDRYLETKEIANWVDQSYQWQILDLL